MGSIGLVDLCGFAENQKFLRKEHLNQILTEPTSQVGHVLEATEADMIIIGLFEPSLPTKNACTNLAKPSALIHENRRLLEVWRSHNYDLKLMVV